MKKRDIVLKKTSNQPIAGMSQSPCFHRNGGYQNDRTYSPHSFMNAFIPSLNAHDRWHQQQWQDLIYYFQCMNHSQTRKLQLSRTICSYLKWQAQSGQLYRSHYGRTSKGYRRYSYHNDTLTSPSGNHLYPRLASLLQHPFTDLCRVQGLQCPQFGFWPFLGKKKLHYEVTHFYQSLFIPMQNYSSQKRSEENGIIL